MILEAFYNLNDPMVLQTHMHLHSCVQGLTSLIEVFKSLAIKFNKTYAGQ